MAVASGASLAIAGRALRRLRPELITAADLLILASGVIRESGLLIQCVPMMERIK